LLTGFEGNASFDLATAICVVALVVAVTTAAGYLPIRRILADDPMAALRHD
jgi:ABC-type antimicrobial peptide transport system permease subunit